MRIMLIDVVCKSGSTGKIVYDIYTELKRCGHEAMVCYGRGKKFDNPDLIRISTKVELYAHAVLARITGYNGYFSPFATHKLIKQIEKFKPDIVHIHDPKTYYLNTIQLYKYLKRKSIKTIFTMHSEYFYTGKCGYAYLCNNWRDDCGNCPQIKEYPKSLFIDGTKKMLLDKKKVFSDFHNVVFTSPSKWLSDRAESSFLRGRKVLTIHNGIEVASIFHPSDEVDSLRQKHNLANEKIVLAVAPDIMSERKGGRAVLDIAKKLKNENVKFILIGVDNTNEQFDENVIALSRTENQQELAKYYSLADVFLICSKCENFPTTCIEALCCGTPVVGFDAGGTKETAPGNYGIFVPYGDTEKLSDVIRDVLAGESSLMSKDACADYGAEHYDKSVMVRHYVDVYNNFDKYVGGGDNI